MRANKHAHSTQWGWGELKERGGGGLFVLLLPSLQIFHSLQLRDLNGGEGSVITINTNPIHTNNRYSNPPLQQSSINLMLDKVNPSDL